LGAKFMACARRALPDTAARSALAMLQEIDTLDDIRSLTDVLQP
jgi:hypothetical protein